jgi:hypothetical protein
MNYLKKFTLSLICLWAFLPYGISQNETTDKKNLSLKPFYTVEVNFGVSTCREVKYNKPSHYDNYNSWYYEMSHNGIEENAKLSYKTLVYGTNFTAGIELTHYAKVGLGIGYLFYKQEDNRIPMRLLLIPASITTHGIPLFLYLRSDFINRKKSPYIDLKIGNNFLVTSEAATIFSPDGWAMATLGKFRLKNGLFLSTNFGIAVKNYKGNITTNISVGYRYISRVYDYPHNIYDAYGMYDSYGGSTSKSKYFKTGFITADHQFVINLGLTF